jgi:hypothetical protein
MAKKEEEIKELVVNESSDGTASVELDDDIELNDGGSINKSEDDSAESTLEQDREEEYGKSQEEVDDIREARRNKRRARKEYHKQVQTEKDTRLQHLQRQNQDLLERLSVVERKTQGTEIARINKAIEDQESRILFAKQKIKEATETGNGDLLTSEQEMWFEARNQHDSLVNFKRQAVAPQQQQTIQAPDPMVQRYASEFMRENEWYDPNGRDPDSKIALTLDQALSDEGWDPKTAEYWNELENRLQRYLPHRYNGDNSGESYSKKRHKSVMTSSGRESSSSGGGRNTFTLSQEQVRAMKDAGMWDDSDKRAKMTRRYIQEARQQKN